MNDIEQLYLQAERYVREYRDGSCAGLQRHLRLGYRDALWLRDRLRAAGAYDGIRLISEPAHWTIKAVGVGGAGCNALETLDAALPAGVEALAINREGADALRRTRARPLELARANTREEDMAAIEAALAGASMVLLAAGPSGSTGAAIAPLVARAAARQGAPCIVTAFMPAPYEGQQRSARAAAALEELERHSDSVLLSPLAPRCADEEEGTLLDLLGKRDREFGALASTLAVMLADERVLRPTLHELLRLLAGRLWMGHGRGEGPAAVEDAIRQACAQMPRHGITGPADGLLALIRMHPSARVVKLARVVAAAGSLAAPHTHVSMAYRLDEALGGAVEVTLLAARHRAA